MLTALAIRNVVLIEALDLAFGPGLGVLTGETGAGKSILLDALGLVLGNRAESGLVRPARRRRAVTARFDTPLADVPIAACWPTTASRSTPGEPLILRRRVKADGGSRGWVNDQPARPGCCARSRRAGRDARPARRPRPGQPARPPRAARAFGRADATAAAGPGPRGARRRARSKTARAIEIEAAQRDRDWLAHAVAELTALEPEAGEEETLAARRRDMQKGEKLADDLAAVGGLCGRIGRRARAAARGGARLERIGDEHPALAEALAALDRAVIEAGEAEDSSRRRREALAFDPARAGGRRDAAVRAARARPQARGQPDELAELARAARRLERSRRARTRSPSSKPRSRRRRRGLRRGRRGADAERRAAAAAARPGGRRRAGAAQARRRALPHRRRAAARGTLGRARHRRRRVPDLDQPRRAVRAADTRSPAAASCRASSSRSRSRSPNRAARRR